MPRAQTAPPNRRDAASAPAPQVAGGLHRASISTIAPLLFSRGGTASRLGVPEGLRTTPAAPRSRPRSETNRRRAGRSQESGCFSRLPLYHHGMSIVIRKVITIDVSFSSARWPLLPQTALDSLVGNQLGQGCEWSSTAPREDCPVQPGLDPECLGERRLVKVAVGRPCRQKRARQARLTQLPERTSALGWMTQDGASYVGLVDPAAFDEVS